MEEVCHELQVENIDSFGFPMTLDNAIDSGEGVLPNRAENRRDLNQVLKRKQQHHCLSSTLDHLMKREIQEQDIHRLKTQ